MKTAKELADELRPRFLQSQQIVPRSIAIGQASAADIAAYLDRLAAIDAAVPGDVVALRSRFNDRERGRLGYGSFGAVGDGALKDCVTLLAIVDRLTAEKAAIATENARTLNELGEAHALQLKTAQALAAAEEQVQTLAAGLRRYRLGILQGIDEWEFTNGHAVPR